SVHPLAQLNEFEPLQPREISQPGGLEQSREDRSNAGPDLEAGGRKILLIRLEVEQKWELPPASRGFSGAPLERGDTPRRTAGRAAALVFGLAAQEEVEQRVEARGRLRG